MKKTASGADKEAGFSSLFLLLFLGVFPALFSCFTFLPPAEYSISIAELPSGFSQVVRVGTKGYTDQPGLKVSTSCNGFRLNDGSRAVITAAHCVSTAAWIGVSRSAVVGSDLEIYYQADRYETVKEDLAADLALLVPYRDVKKENPPIGYPVASPGLKRGDIVFFFDKDFQIRRSMVLHAATVDTEYRAGINIWVIEQEAREGDSGSAVFNSDGNFVGVLVAASFDQGLVFLVEVKQEEEPETW